MRAFNLIWNLFWVFIILLLLAGVFVTPAIAHEWYPTACCHSQDCYEISMHDVDVVPGGYRIKATGEFIPYDQTRQTPAEAGHTFHRCSAHGNPANNTFGKYQIDGYCFWVPQGGA